MTQRIHRQAENSLQILVNRATEETLQDIRDNAQLNQIATASSVSVTDSGQSHTITSGKTNLLIQNLGSAIVAIGGSGVAYGTGYRITPMGGYVFKNCPSGFQVYFICDTGETATVTVQEM